MVLSTKKVKSGTRFDPSESTRLAKQLLAEGLGKDHKATHN
jgi:hypothetical protein